MSRMHMKHLIDARKAGRQTGTGTVAASVSLSLCPSVVVVAAVVRQQRPLFTNIIPFPAKAITTPSRPLHRRHAHTHTHTDVHMHTYSHREGERGHMCMSRRHCCECKHTDRRRGGRTNGGTWLAYGACTTYSSRPSSTYLRSTTA